MSGRRLLSAKAKYGFNGKLKDNEDYGEGNAYDYGFRIYNPRLGRFLSEDPLSHEYPWFTPYQFSGNTPISAIDLDGLENIYINNNTDNRGECMEVIYSADDIAIIMAGKKPEFKVHYENSGKTTDQFEGPNKVNEDKVFQATKPLLVKSGITQYIKDKPDDKDRDFLQIRNNYEVPAPTPKKPKLPKPDPKPIAPPLSIDFKGGSDEFKTPSQVDALVKPVAKYLIKNQKEKINLSGNTGVVGDPNSPTGTGKDVLESPT